MYTILYPNLIRKVRQTQPGAMERDSHHMCDDNCSGDASHSRVCEGLGNSRLGTVTIDGHGLPESYLRELPT